jgi:hypothetical protein
VADLTIDVGKVGGELRQILQSVDKEKPAKADLVRLETYLIAHPEHTEHIGNLAKHAQTTMLSAFLSSARGLQMAVATRIAVMMAELGYPTASMLERLLIDAIVTSWLRTYTCELKLEAAQSRSNATPESLLFWERKLSMSHRRHLRAIESLARVHRLLRLGPPVQVNIADKQIVLP